MYQRWPSPVPYQRYDHAYVTATDIWHRLFLLFWLNHHNQYDNFGQSQLRQPCRPHYKSHLAQGRVYRHWQAPNHRARHPPHAMLIEWLFRQMLWQGNNLAPAMRHNQLPAAPHHLTHQGSGYNDEYALIAISPQRVQCLPQG